MGRMKTQEPETNISQNYENIKRYLDIKVGDILQMKRRKYKVIGVYERNILTVRKNRYGIEHKECFNYGELWQKRKSFKLLKSNECGQG